MNPLLSEKGLFSHLVNQRCFRMSELPNAPEYTVLKKYFHEIAKKFCPFMEPSSKKELLHFSHYVIEPRIMSQEYVFYISLVHTELLRKQRRETGTGVVSLSCDNVIFSAQDGFIDGCSLVEWPHWILKLMYTDCGLAIGKFWEGQSQVSRFGEVIPQPPCNFLSLRCKMQNLDRRFFETKANFLLPAHDDASDTGQSVLSKIIPKEHEYIINMLNDLDYDNASFSEISHICEKMEEVELYKDALRWAHSCGNLF